jgi:hypothetical protein
MALPADELRRVRPPDDPRDRQDASERFYDTVLAPLGIDRTYRTGTFSEWQELQLTGADDTRPVTRRLHVGFLAPSRDQVAAFWRAGTEAGYPDDGRPGPRPEYRSDYYGAFPARSDGNSAEAVHHGGLRRGDHRPPGSASAPARSRSCADADRRPPPGVFLKRRRRRPALSSGRDRRAAYRSNGPPGERPRYHPGYYATYVLDADGNNVEVVSHHRP